MTKTLLRLLTLFILSSLAGAQSGTITDITMTWNGLKRDIRIYRPPVTHNPAAVIIVLHGTTQAAITSPPLNVYHNMGLDQIADSNGPLIVAPMGTWKQDPKHVGEFFWEAKGTETFFPVEPDDSGFLAALARLLVQNYGVDPGQLTVMGFSSGGMMAQRLCMEHADIFAACGILSGSLYVGPAPDSLPLPSQAVSIRYVHGDADLTIPYCGGRFFGWNEGWLSIPSADVTLNYWLAANGLAPNPQAICTNGIPTANMLSFKSPNGNIEVQFVRELNYAHTWKQPTIAAMVEFLSTHGR